MENLRKRVDIELVQTKKIALKRIAKPNFKRAKRFRDDLVAIHVAKPVLVLNRPIQVGFAILDLSKVHMYGFHYTVWMPKFPHSRLLFTDTDSLAYAVDKDDLYAGMAEMASEFDFNEYPTTHPLHSTVNMKVVGKFKDELHGELMEKFVGLRPKLYSYTMSEGRVEKHTAEGVKKSVKKKHLTFADYERCVTKLESKSVRMNYIRSDYHHLYTYSTEKVGLSAFDNKRWICTDGISTLAHGHYSTL